MDEPLTSRRAVAPAVAGITGRTRLLAVIGDPVVQVRAPVLVNDLLRALGRDAVLVPLHVPAGRLAAVLAGLDGITNLDGLLVTVPHKPAARALAARESRAVTVTGSTNALRREADGSWTADNFDGSGFVAGLRAAGYDPCGRTVTVFGAGGAGASIAAAVLEARAARLQLVDPRGRRRQELAERLEAVWPGRCLTALRPDLSGTQLAVNATPLGMRPDDPLPFEPAGLPPGAMVADIIMDPARTALLRAAAAAGLRTHPGLPMLTHQLDDYRRFFRLEDPSPAG